MRLCEMRGAARSHNERGSMHSFIRKLTLPVSACEDSTCLEQANVALHTREVEFRAPRKRIEHILPQERFVFGQRIPDTK
jgi:hypothetical protein